jgi:hypothetical protein
MPHFSMPKCCVNRYGDPDRIWSQHGMISLMGIDTKDFYEASIIKHNCKLKTQCARRGHDEVSDAPTQAARREMDRIQYISAVKAQWARCELERLLRRLLAMESPSPRNLPLSEEEGTSSANN